MKRLTIALLAVTLLAGCGRVVEEVAEQAAEQAIERGIESDSGGDVDIEFSGGDLPDELTVDLPGGYEVLSSSTMTDDTVTFASAILDFRRRPRRRRRLLRGRVRLDRRQPEGRIVVRRQQLVVVVRSRMPA